MILENKVALVTGGTSGIGRATAIAFGTAEAKVVFSGRREAEGEETAALIRNARAQCLFVRSDVSSELDVKGISAEDSRDLWATRLYRTLRNDFLHCQQTCGDGADASCCP
jgi:NAD(P)-dependent dehydrogenase (short-subunit alcohol dehydrogenase family)